MGKKIQCIGRYVMDGVTLGKGNFAKVELATHGVTGCKVAIKIMDTRKIKEDYTRNNLHREARILGQIRHPNIIRLYETLKATTLYCLVLEYASGGDLLAFIKSQKEGRLLESSARCFFRQLISAMHFLHERGVAHRDLKMENILLDEKCKNIKVIDFGLSNTYGQGELMKTHCGSLEYAAPELIATNDRYGPEVDIWSMGVILYGMVIGKLPFSTHYTDQYRRQKLQQQIEKGLIESHHREMVILTSDCIELLKKVLEPSLELRLPLSEMQTHPWVTQHSKIPFHTFQHLPKDKSSKSLDLDFETDTEEVIEELAALLETPKEKIENVVHESKCDDLSAMFNMMLDCRRQDKGVFDIDFTLKQEEKTKHHRRRHRHRHKEENPKHATPAILCPDIKTDASSDHEGEPHVNPSHNSTNFDLMALCSAPTWLGPERRKTRRRRSPLPPPSPLCADGTAAIAENPPQLGTDPSHLLSPGQASTQVSALLRRSSSRRRSRRTTSADPPSRHSSFHSRRSTRRSRPGTPSTGPHSPNSPSNLNNPEIKIDTPKQSPVPIVRRPANLLLKECHTASVEQNAKSNLEPSKVSKPSRRRRIGRDHTHDHRDNADSNPSDSSNPCSTTNLIEGLSDGSTEMLSHPDSRPDSRNSVIEQTDDTVESKIAATDIRSIVRPKQFVLRGVVNGPSKTVFTDSVSGLKVPNSNEVDNRCLSASPEVIIESMQPSTYANLSDDEKLEQNRKASCESPKTDSEKRVELGTFDLRLPTLISSSDYVDSSTECLGAAALKTEVLNHSNTSKYQRDNAKNSERGFYANLNESANVFSNDRHIMADGTNTCFASNNPNLFEQDVYSKQDKISLDAQNDICDDDVCFVDSSDHNSSQENLLTDRPRNKLESLTSDENESHSAPVLISARGFYSPKGDDDIQVLPKVGSVRSSRHGSTPSIKFKMPSTPIRQMFKTPIARIESFHSDDFDAFNSDIDALVTSPTPSPNSAQTPTVPCFQYKLHSRHKKNSLNKHMKARRSLIKDGVQCTKDGFMTLLPEKPARSDHGPSEQFFSSGSECGSDGQVPDGERASTTSKAKIYPMDRDDEQVEHKLHKIADKKLNDNSAVIKEVSTTQSNSKKYQNSVSKTSNTKSETKKSGMKTVWKKGFAHLLKKRKFGNLSSSGNNNNDEENPSRNHRSSNNRLTRNGHARGTVPVSPAGSHDVQETTVDIQWSSTALIPNNVPASANVKPSPPPSPSPTRAKVYDFTVITSETHKENPCFLSWRACRECTFSDDHSSPENSEGNVCLSEANEQSDINVTSIPMATFQETSTFSCSTAHS